MVDLLLLRGFRSGIGSFFLLGSTWRDWFLFSWFGLSGLGLMNSVGVVFPHLCHNGFPFDLDDHKNQNEVAIDLFCMGVISHSESMFLN